jgi:hypothetical protein
MFEDLKRVSNKHKNNKFKYYLEGYFNTYAPKFLFRCLLKSKLSAQKQFDSDYLQMRIDYYNRLNHVTMLPDESIALKNFKLPEKLKVYFFDTLEYTRFFPAHLKIKTLFGDITHVPEIPSITKSRPIKGDNANSVLLKLGKVRHFMFVKDSYPFEDKKDMLIGRSNAMQEHRIRFLNQYIDHPLCDVGQVNRDKNFHLIRNRVTVDEHLKFKFILCLEGNDVASNLKWVMSSNSVAVMPEPTYETWFMEGTLIPDFHYIRIKEDFSDLEERLTYYINHPEKCKEIVAHAQAYVEPFKNKKREQLINLLVLKKYFEKTGQSLSHHS